MGSPLATGCTAMILDSSCITGCSCPACGWGKPKGLEPYSMMPGRTQSPWACGQASTPAELHRLLATSPRSAVALRTASSCCSVRWPGRSEEHTSELQSRPHLVCRLLLEKKKKKKKTHENREKRTTSQPATHVTLD